MKTFIVNWSANYQSVIEIPDDVPFDSKEAEKLARSQIVVNMEKAEYMDKSIHIESLEPMEA